MAFEAVSSQVPSGPQPISGSRLSAPAPATTTQVKQSLDSFGTVTNRGAYSSFGSGYTPKASSSSRELPPLPYSDYNGPVDEKDYEAALNLQALMDARETLSVDDVEEEGVIDINDTVSLNTTSDPSGLAKGFSGATAALGKNNPNLGDEKKNVVMAFAQQRAAEKTEKTNQANAHIFANNQKEQAESETRALAMSTGELDKTENERAAKQANLDRAAATKDKKLYLHG